jgi:integrase/recombinase XerD
MAQAKTLTPAELEQVLAYIASRNFALRNRVMLLTGFYSGMRVGEIARLSSCRITNQGTTTTHGVYSAKAA